ncbi:MAG: transposase [Desulfobacteraceae bacterium]|jgi:hypothetical protein|nr:transposase [Desulfobacteraceae bacterium]
MILIKDHKQTELFDPWRFLSPKRRDLLDKTWPGLFKNIILPELPVSRIFPFFSEGYGRPTKELYTVLGVLVLQQTLDLTDEETCSQLTYNIQWHYALNITEESDSAKYMCPKTLWTMRSILVDNVLDGVVFECVTKKLADVFKVDLNNQRIDSVHIKSNMRRLGRIGIFVSGINKFIKNLKRQNKDLFESIHADLIDRYLPEKSLQCFSMVKPSLASKTLSMVSNDLFDLVMQFKSHSEVTVMHSYKQLEQILNEQCNVEPANGGSGVQVKPPKEIPSSSLQNPSDPDASYSGHKGQGYQVQIMETYAATDDKEVREKSLNLITHVQVEPAHESDANALLPAVASAKERDLAPKEILADSLYGSDDNCQKTKRAGVEIVSPTMGEKKETILCLSEFETSASGKILACPQGLAPETVKKKKTRHTAAFDSLHCSGCPNQAHCPVKKGKKHYYLRYTEKEMRIAKRRAYEQTDEFKDRYRWRSGVEATMSEYDRRTGVKQLRVRGFDSVRFCATLKAAGINILRAVAVWIALNPESNSNKPGRLDLNHAFLVFKERLLRKWRHLKNEFSSRHRYRTYA